MTAFTPDFARSLDGPEWLRARRAGAAERFVESSLPTSAEELWRYSRIDALDLDRFSPSIVTEASFKEALPPIDADVTRNAETIATVNGRIASRTGDIAVDLAEEADGGNLLGSVAGPEDAFVEMNSGFHGDAVLIDVPAGKVLAKPIVVVHWLDAAGTAQFPRTVVRLGEQAEATVVEYVAGPDVELLSVPVVELDLGAASNLRFVSVQNLGRNAWQIAHHASRVERDATLRSVDVALGGYYARVRTDSSLVGQGANSYLLAAYFGDRNQMHDFRTLQDHDARKSLSDLLFKGAVADDSQSVYSGLIRVRKGASGTEAFQTNRNLVLSKGAHAESVPNLEILENDVKCSHASAVGPIDEDQRYYLESRGVPPWAADRLIVQGFFDEIIEQIPVEGLRTHLRSQLSAKLPQVQE